MSTPERAIVDAAIAYIAALDYFNTLPGWGSEKDVNRLSSAHIALETAVRKLTAESPAPAQVAEMSAIGDTPCELCGGEPSAAGTCDRCWGGAPDEE